MNKQTKKTNQETNKQTNKRTPCTAATCRVG